MGGDGSVPERLAWREPWSAHLIRCTGGPFDRSPWAVVKGMLRHRRRLFDRRRIVEIDPHQVSCDHETLAFSAIREVKVVQPRLFGRKVTILLLRKQAGGFHTVGIASGIGEGALAERLRNAVWDHRRR